MATATAKTPAKTPVKATDVQALMISTIKTVKSFRRAGLSFTQTPTLVPLTDLAEDQIKALKAEPMLIVHEVTELDDDAKAAIQSGAGE
ncbi:HI1506-related protein [Oceanobacter sp. 4_MG-2023]|uniref:HI1506-related protein n=1 Tax=Oceanobacter sp. 4_MG-2023 TaxID=3062623 RepID=UPI0027373927|nr:HI1506-related protein [Oceanobacter sp. 4_MG-2023]MDP2548487.1 HI1506-related protein [Oceanobacter sp. 4_MG-2023]